MSSSTGAWIAQLIRIQQESLITMTAEAVRAGVPGYSRLPDAALRAIFDQVYVVFACSLETDDVGPWRNYFQAALEARARVGIPPAGIIATVEIVQGQVQALAERHLPADSIPAGEVRSILRSTANRIRMVVSQLNLAHLTGQLPPTDPPEE